MFTLTKEFTFEAAHKLPHHDGKCQRLHGHSWKGRVVFQGRILRPSGPKSGMLVDYADISRMVKPLVENYLDHHYLNESLELESPTSEAIATWIHRRLSEVLILDEWDLSDVVMVAVEIDETCTCSCRYEP